MPDPELIEYVRQNLKKFGAKTLRNQLVKDGVAPKDIEEAIDAVSGKRPKNKLALYTLAGGAVLIIAAGFLSMEKKPTAEPEAASKAVLELPAGGEAEEEGEVFRGHYGYMFKLPPKYVAHQIFLDARKTHERVYIYPKGTDHQHLIHEGLFGAMGILRLDITRRRVPQGFIGIDTVKSWVTNKLDRDKASYTLRETMVQNMPAFIVNIEKPFKGTKAYIVGEKVRYEITGGEEKGVFTSVISSLYEASPHDRPGR